MDQKQLREWERRCIQEEPPFCQAACPLHVDGRAFLGLLAKADTDGARKVLERTLPLPSVLGRICEAPCEAACKRREAGDALALGRLERFAISAGRPGMRPMRLPGRKGEALLFGFGLAALTCAWDLLKKGYGVTLRTLGQPLGGALATWPEAVLPKDALPNELATLKALGLILDERPGAASGLLEQALADGRAVFLEWGWSPETDAAYPARAIVDSVTLAGPAPGLFFGGWPAPFAGAAGQHGGFCAIDAAADGRRAASSLDRHLSGASLTASREREGACATRLFTSLVGVVPAPRVLPAAHDYSKEEAQAEAARCLNCQCLECVRVCDYLEKHKAYPKIYARQIYNNAAIVRGQHLANKLINSCSLCGLCERVCPEHFNMADLCLTARQDMVARGVMPPSAHEFALEEMADANGPHFALAKPDPDAKGAAYVFFPGCQLAASSPQHVEQTYAFLRAQLSGGVGLMLRCCGIPAHWAGEEALLRQAVAEFVAAWETLGKPQIIAACSSCLSMFRLPAFREAAPDLSAVSLWRTLDSLPLPGIGYLPRPSLALHDPCTSREDPDFQAAVRSILNRLGVPYKELALTGELTECCGFGGLMAQVDAPLAHQVAARRAGEAKRDYVAACAMCRDRLFAAGKRCMHLLDLVFPCQDGDPAGQPGPGYSGRQEARAALKDRLLRDVWGEEPEHAALDVTLFIAPEVQAQLEERRILLSDVRQTISEALAQGRCLRDDETGRLLASSRPRRVTFWAEFCPEQTGYRLLKAYSHRMIVPGAGGADQPPAEVSAKANRVDQTYVPDSGAWRCAGCNTPLNANQVVVSYLGSVFTISLLTCPACGLTLVPEPLALGRMAEVEQLLEDK
jgi:Fe-S oxidoreductase